MWWYFLLQLAAVFFLSSGMFNFIPVPQNNQFLKWMDVWCNPIISYVKNWNRHPMDSQPTNKVPGWCVDPKKLGLGERFYSEVGFFQQPIKPAHVRQMSQISQSSDGIANSSNQKMSSFFSHFWERKKNTNLHLFFSPASCCLHTHFCSALIPDAPHMGRRNIYLYTFTIND